MQALFLNEYARLRSGWRALIFLLSFLLIASVAIFAALAVLSQVPFGESATSMLPLATPFAISAVIAVGLGWMYGRIFENVPFRALGCAFTAGWIKHFAGGLSVGAIAFVIAVV